MIITCIANLINTLTLSGIKIHFTTLVKKRKMRKHSSIKIIWQNYLKSNPGVKERKRPIETHFCDNQKDADECAYLVQKSIKQATSTSDWWYKKYKMQYPKIGDQYIITNWDGEAKAIIETTKVSFVKYCDISEEYAVIEGEGDKTLDYWKSVHWAYYIREMKPFKETPHEEMIIVCEEFKTIYSMD